MEPPTATRWLRATRAATLQCERQRHGSGPSDMSRDFFEQQGRRGARRSERRRALRRRRLTALGVVVAVVIVGIAAAVIVMGRGDAVPVAGSDALDIDGTSADGTRSPAAAAAQVSPSAVATGTTDARAQAAAGEGPELASAAPPLRQPTKKDPLRVYFGGDSLSGMPGVMFAQRAKTTGLLKVTVDYQTSSRLTVPDPVDWPERLRAQLGARRYDVAVFMIGMNDTGMPMVADGTSTMYPKKAWLREYQSRVEKLMHVMMKGGAERVYWVGLPVMPEHGQTQAVEDLNRLFEDAAAKNPDAVYVDTFPVLATNSGAFDPRLRSGDGVHFTNEGATLLADAVWRAMKDDWRAQTPLSSPSAQSPD
jgi:hypothetical protein